MSFNPYDEEYFKLDRQIMSLKNQIYNIQSKIQWYDSVNLASLTSELLSLKNKEMELKRLINISCAQDEKIQDDIIVLKGKIKSLLNPFYWFSSKQNKLRKEKNMLLSERRNLLSQIEYYKTKYIENEKAKQDKELNILEYEEFQRPKQVVFRNTLMEELAEKEIDWIDINRKRENVDIELRPTLELIAMYQNDIQTSSHILERAESFEWELENTYNKYEKSQIHDRCENELGASSPRYIINSERNKLNALDRNLKKAEAKAYEIGRKSARVIKKIIIDGSNMCHIGKQFVGLDPLKYVVGELEKKYEVLIIFDASIRNKLDTRNNYLESIFKKSKIHIVQNGSSADETILNLAENDKTCYILSNDRFVEYSDKEVVKQKRLINHEIVDGRVLINDLKINLSFND